ncbi:hypothetical protein TPHA_0E01510 [Tetrapisispora phaffii CBS 4417]|uniref:Crossover junction endonuclease MUS81 n=1 Tax=Tetrapisispora phaffii (strain ATCC 24235 / CBS 4417 / NBRC 1672 / NRRL Y-8282 / UCD 70-5) TaxID=1071381 RepID=G8BTL7_TETPH|nr:hypothetical protein TPHA_0E01510 [Tetrapisispora phaffii CBS 4417]CCE63245.1 hypothetical protein TPHA_0E01510 [Tetrapisispora phaffii CBS 4417]
MSLPFDLKQHYVDWLQELINSYGSHQEQVQITYERAKRNLIDSQETFHFPSDLKKVKGIGEAIAKKLEVKLKEYCKKNSFEFPSKIENEIASNKRSTTTLRSTTIDSDVTSRPLKKKRKYIPKKRSGGYAILLALLESGATEKGLTKDDIIEIAQKYCNNSMLPNYTTKELHGSWSSITSLRNNYLILEEGRPKRFSLTEEGHELAKTLKEADGIIFENEGNTTLNQNKFWNDPNEVTADLTGLFANKSFPSQPDQGNSSKIIDVTFKENENLVHGIISQTGTTNKANYTLANKEGLIGNGLINGSATEASNIVQKRYNNISYQLWNRGSYDIFPIIDHREVKSVTDREFFINAFHRKGVHSELRQLSLGDIIWVARHKVTKTICILDTIIERKRLDDLASSIRDNRFMEQKTRLEKSGCQNKIYLIEETIGINNNNIQVNMDEALKTALWLILVYYKFSMIRTSNSEETVEKLCYLHEVISKHYLEKDLIVIYPDNITSQESYYNILHDFKKEFERNKSIECCHTIECFQEIMGKSESRTIGEITINILMLIRGVSLEKAIAIQSIYPTLNHILKAYQSCKSPSEAKLLLYNKLGNAPGTKRITKSLSEKISEVFYDN